MKKYPFACAVALLLTTALVLTIHAFNKERVAITADDSRPKVITTIFPQYDFARAIGGDNTDISMLLKPGMESHLYSPSPQDIINIQNCDLFIYIGGENDRLVDKIIDSLDEDKRPQILKLIDCVSPVKEEWAEGMQKEHRHDGHDHAHGEIEKKEYEHGDEYDEHIWTSPRNAQKMVVAIMDKLTLIDPQNRRLYEENAKAYIANLDKLDKDFRQMIAKGKRRRLIFGDRFPFRYLTDEYGLNYSAAFPGCASESEASAATIAYLIDKVKKENIPVVFHLEMSNEKTADAICRETGASKMLLHACHNISLNEFENGATYIGLMQKNLENIKEALN